MAASDIDTGLRDPIIRGVRIEAGGAPAAAQGAIAGANGLAAATTAGVDYVYTWTEPTVQHVLLQNNTAASLNYDIDAPATAGSMLLAANATVFLDISMSALHILTAGAENVNGSTAGNVVIRAWL